MFLFYFFSLTVVCVQQNLKMSPAMLSRFDLIFLLLDRPDADRDERLTKHVLAAHAELKAQAPLTHRNPSSTGAAAISAVTGRGGMPTMNSGRPSLLERLKVVKPDDEHLPKQLLRKYIAYARQYCHPRLSGTALCTELLRSSSIHIVT